MDAETFTPQHQALSLCHSGLFKDRKQIKMLWILELKFPYCCDTRGENSWLTAVMNEKLIITTYVNIMVFPLLAPQLPLQIFHEERKSTAANFIFHCFICSLLWCCTIQHFTLLVNRMRTQSNLNFFLWIPTPFFAEFQNRIE